MKFCSECGGSVTYRMPVGDNRSRFICDNCHAIHYQNPKVITGCLPIYQDKVLLCRRAIEPRYGLWTLPAGFMENGETSEEGALRESWEEARTSLKPSHLYRLFDLPYINQVYLFYLAELTSLDFSPGPESLEVALFTETDIPWEQLAFKAVDQTLKHYFDGRSQGDLAFKSVAIQPPKGYLASNTPTVHRDEPN